jgi:DNA-binding MarR family transcriptional regulator
MTQLTINSPEQRFYQCLTSLGPSQNYVNMTDLKFSDVKSGSNLLFLRETELRQGIELLFFAYRDFTAGPDAILDELGFGRAHHRAIHFIGRHPNIIVGDLLALLKITKQSLNRVLRDLMAAGLVEQQKGVQDRRQRNLNLTETGRELERRLSAPQHARVAQAYRDAGADAVAGFRKVLTALLDPAERDEILNRINRP